LTKAELLSSIVENSGALDQLTVNFTFPEMKEVITCKYFWKWSTKWDVMFCFAG